MSRGLGKTQKYILDFLGREGKAVSATNLACFFDVPDGDPPVKPTKSAIVSMRRAIHTLHNRRLIQCGLAGIATGGALDALELYCWLPGQEPPPNRCEFEIKASLADATVLDALKKAKADPYGRRWLIDPNGEQMHQTRDTTAPEVFCEYESVTNIALHSLERIAHLNTARVAIRRSVERLTEQGIIEAYKNEKHQYAWLRLSVAPS